MHVILTVLMPILGTNALSSPLADALNCDPALGAGLICCHIYARVLEYLRHILATLYRSQAPGYSTRPGVIAR